MKLRNLTEEQFDRKLVIIMSLVGIILLISGYGYRYYKQKQKEEIDYLFSSGDLVISSFNQTCLCSTKCFLKVCNYENTTNKFEGDSFIISANMSEENCNICEG